MAPRLLLFLLLFQPILAEDLVISRPARPAEFIDSVGPRSGLFGQENGTVEAFVYPLKLFKDLRLRFITEDGRVLPGETLARQIIARPGAVTVIYSGDEFHVTQTLIASVSQPGGIIRLNIRAYGPLRIEAEFTRDFQLMWPASFGSGYAEWDAKGERFVFGADGQPYSGVLGAPGATLLSREYATNYSAENSMRFSLGTFNGSAEKTIAFAASMTSRSQALATYQNLIQDPAAEARRTDEYYRDFLSHSTQAAIPDKKLQAGYEWAQISLHQGVVENPFLGKGLVAGYGPSKGGYRPGYGWFFGRDSCWSSLALTAMGDFPAARAALAFIAKFQGKDGKIPHEISQAASLVPWWEKYPYGFASADATPLYIIAVRDYVDASGDLAFLREQSDHLRLAYSFMQSTLDPAGFPRNFGVGHGWVEGGPLLPVRTEFYQAGVYVEALRSLAVLAQLQGDNPLASKLDQQYQRQHAALQQNYWLPGEGIYAYAIGQDGKTVPRASVLATVPMWFGVTDPASARRMLTQLGREEHAADWGLRIISDKSDLYGPAGYHFGSVWPLFTGWASVAAYRNHDPSLGMLALQSNAFLTLEGAGNPFEVLSGASYTPLTTGSPHQIWSAAMVVSPMLRGLFGWESNVVQRQAHLTPHPPAEWETYSLRSLPAGPGTLSVEWRRKGEEIEMKVENTGPEPYTLDYAPAFLPVTTLKAARWNGTEAAWKKEENGSDWHARFSLNVKPGSNVLTLSTEGFFGFTLPFQEPVSGQESRGLRLVSEAWTTGAATLTVSGKPGQGYRIRLTGNQLIASIDGAEWSKGSDQMTVMIPASSGADYTDRKISIRFAGGR